MSGRFNENTRVQVPAAIHLCRLGYTYLDHIDAADYDPSTNILIGVFKDALLQLNPGLSDAEINLQLAGLVHAAKNDDLGREFFKKITTTSGIRFVDFDNPANNLWHCTTEFTCENPETHDNFRPDITCFVNGIPLAFIEVKKPNNHEGMLAERERINTRFRNSGRSRKSRREDRIEPQEDRRIGGSGEDNLRLLVCPVRLPRQERKTLSFVWWEDGLERATQARSA